VKVVEVLWGDAWVDTDDITVAKAVKSKPVYRRTVGFLVADNEDGLVLVTDCFEDNEKEVNTPMFIPHGMVVEWWEYK
jgi:hypothetical protein